MPEQELKERVEAILAKEPGTFTAFLNQYIFYEWNREDWRNVAQGAILTTSDPVEKMTDLVREAIRGEVGHVASYLADDLLAMALEEVDYTYLAAGILLDALQNP